jgi:hypothetical protein
MLYLGRLRLCSQILGWKDLPGTTTLVHWAHLYVTKKIIWAILLGFIGHGLVKSGEIGTIKNPGQRQNKKFRKCQKTLFILFMFETKCRESLTLQENDTEQNDTQHNDTR